MNATRFALKPIQQPTYPFSNVPPAEKDLRGSTLHCLTDREAWQSCMGEMLLVCKEAIRRRRRQMEQQADTEPPLAATSTATEGESVEEEEEDKKPKAVAVAVAVAAHPHAHGSKPLSLEYIADRLDVDDPIWGFVVRHEEGEMLQGFIAVTTFTNYQRTFRWDSTHPRSFIPEEEEEEHDDDGINHDGNDDNDHYDMANRKVDSDGSLAREMNATVRAGDIWNEGIVWPRIAEIGLLGGLACGRTLVKLVIEQLECMKRSSRANYDYVVLQATDNSISFYESLGFVRVGAVMQQENNADFQEPSPEDCNNYSSSDDAQDEPLALDDDSRQGPKDDQQQPTALATPGARVVLSKTLQYTTTKVCETPTQIAKKLFVNVHDIIFLNQSLYPELAPYSKMRVGTILLIPDTEIIAPPPPPPPETLADDQKMEQQQQQPVSWYIAKENETPRSIARKLGLDCVDLVNANKVRLQGLLSSSRLKDGTRVKVSHFDSPTELYKPYAHWTFPDDKFEEGEPSYMMALKLNRCSTSKKKNKEYRPFANSLAVPVVDYEPSNNNINKQDNDDGILLQSTDDPAASAAAGPPRPGRASRRRWQSHQDAESCSTSNSNSSSTTTTMTTATNPDTADDDDEDDNDEISIQAMPKLPLKPAFVEPYRLFVADFKRDHADLLYKKHVGESSRITGDAWRKLSPRKKQAYDQRIAAFKHEYETAMQVYRQQVASIRHAKEQRRLKKQRLARAAAAAAAAPPAAAAQAAPLPVVVQQQSSLSSSINLFNKVVKLKPGSIMTEAGSLHYEYWYVLTYIPDLQWCHLAPMYKVGRVFGDDKPKSIGRPIWKLVDESLGEEVDITSSLVIPVKAKSMKRTLDADKEEWDIIGTPLPLTAPAPSRSNSFGSGFNSSHMMQSVSRRGSLGDSTYDGSSVATSTVATTTTATRTSHKRKRSNVGSEMSATSASSKQLPSFAMAVMPQTGKRVKVWIKLGPGQRGRPKGSKNKRPKLVPHQFVTTGQKKPPPSSYTNNNSNNNNNNNTDDDNKNGGRSSHHSTRNNSRVKVVMPVDVMASLEHASSPVKRQRQQTANSKEPPAKRGRPALASQKSHSAVLPANQKARNSKESVAAKEMGGTLAAIDRPDNGDDAQPTASVPPPANFPVGSVVVVQPRTLAGRYKPGGVARVTRVQQSGDSILYDVTYVLGGRVKDVEEVFLSWHDNSSSNNSNSTRPLPKREVAVADTQSNPVEKQPDSEITSQEESTRPVEKQTSSSSLPLVNHLESKKASVVFPVGSVVVVQARQWPGCNKPGGVARVTRVQQGESILFDVKYVLGGSEKSVEEVFLSLHDDSAVRRALPSSEVVTGMKASTSTTDKQQDSQKTTFQESAKDKSTSPLVNHPASKAAAHSDVDATASGGENNSQPEPPSSRLRTKRFSTLALLDDGTRGRETPRSKSVRTRSTSCIESSSSILTEVAPYPNKRSNKRMGWADGTLLPSPSSRRRRVRDPLELLMP